MGRRSRRRIADAAAGAPAPARAAEGATKRRSSGGAAAVPASGGAANRRTAGGQAASAAPGRGRTVPPAAGPAQARAAAPDPPWAPFPLVELAILIAIVLLVVGFLSPGPRGRVLLGCGLGLASLAALELTIREHFAGFRSHASLLAGAAAVAVAALLYAVTRLPQPIPLAVAAAVFGTLWHVLRAAHLRARRSGPG